MRWTVVALVAALALASAADAPFNKEELEAILKAEHSQKISNVYDSTNDIQCENANATGFAVWR